MGVAHQCFQSEQCEGSRAWLAPATTHTIESLQDNEEGRQHVGRKEEKCEIRLGTVRVKLSVGAVMAG